MVQLTEASGCARPETAGAEGRLQLWSRRRKCMMESWNQMCGGCRIWKPSEATEDSPRDLGWRLPLQAPQMYRVARQYARAMRWSQRMGVVSAHA